MADLLFDLTDQLGVFSLVHLRSDEHQLTCLAVKSTVSFNEQHFAYERLREAAKPLDSSDSTTKQLI